MDTLAQVWAVAVRIASQVAEPRVSIYWLYLSSALLIALGVWWGRERAGRPWWHFVSWCFPAEIWRNRSVWHDVGVFTINAVLYSFLLLGPLQTVSTIGQGTSAALEAWLGAPEVPIAGSPWILSMTVAVVLTADLAFFAAHWLQHRVPVLWAFHKVHHSAPVLQSFAPHVTGSQGLDVMVAALASEAEGAPHEPVRLVPISALT